MSARRIVLVVLAALALVAAPTAFAEGIDKGFAGLGADAAGFDQAIAGTPLNSCLREHRQNESNIVIEARRDQAAAKRSTTRWMAVSAR